MLVHRSNQTERLFEGLTRVLEVPSTRWSEPETIVVQGRGMERWLAMKLAEARGIWACPRFPFPRTFLEEVLDLVSPPSPGSQDAKALEPEALPWAVAAALPDLLGEPSFGLVKEYLCRSQDPGPRLHDLCARIAECFDRYLVGRPEWLLSWEHGQDAHLRAPRQRPDGRVQETSREDEVWQAELWRHLVSRHGAEHLARRALEAQTRLLELSPSEARGLGIPARVCLFGMVSLPPLYLALLRALSQVSEVHLFLLSPTPEWFGDAKPSAKEVAQQLNLASSAPSSEGKEPTAPRMFSAATVGGHPLVQDLGRLGREFLELLTDQVDDISADDHFEPLPGASCLQRLQRGLLALDPEIEPPVPQDRSLQVHACHSPMREVEVLHDLILDTLDGAGDCTPEDICVLTPDIGAYAPYIDAVFGSAGRIPFHIADRRARATSGVVDGFLRFLDLLPGRLRASELLDLLAIDAVRERFDVAPSELSRVREMVRTAEIRWGADADHRAAEGQPRVDTHTWRFGLDRLLLGFAMDDRRLFGSLLPASGVEGQDQLALLGSLTSFAETVFRWRSELSRPRRMDEWQVSLSETLASLMSEEGSSELEHQWVRAAIDQLARGAATAEYRGELDLEAVRTLLGRLLDSRAGGRGFLTGGVTFGQLVPMRSIPFSVIALLGMNDDAFPRQDRPLGFDLMAKHRKRGDRTPRDEDRQLFLEAILSTREALIITYVGQGARDNARLPPSVVVEELIEAAVAGALDASHAKESLVQRHPLQAFSPRYFRPEAPAETRPDSLEDTAPGGGAWFSFSGAAARGADALERARAGRPKRLPPFVEGPLTIIPSAAPEVLSLEALELFIRSPARAFARSLGVSLGQHDDEVRDREPLELDTLERWELGTALLEARLQGDLREGDFLARQRAAGRLPPGALGRYALDHLVPVVEALAAEAEPLLRGQPFPPIPVDHELGGGTRLIGTLRDVWPDGQTQAHYADVEHGRDLVLWIRHLALNLVTDAPHRSALIGRGRGGSTTTLRFRPVDDPAGLLRELAGLYRSGHERPLPLFARASRAFVHAKRRGLTEADALLKARASFGRLDEREMQTRWGPPADTDDIHIRRVFRGTDPLVDAPRGGLPFAPLAERVYGPLLDSLEES